MSAFNQKPWPQMADYPQTETGWNQYANAWVARRRHTALISQIPMAAIEEHRQAMELGRNNGWQETDD